jgi:hypothetical protein
MISPPVSATSPSSLPEADVRWSTKGRALIGLFVPVLAALSWYSFTSTTQPNDTVGYLAAAAAVGALALQLHFATYRVRADADGITETSFFGRRAVSYGDVQRVEFIAQRGNGRQIARWASGPGDAFHVIVHSKRGRISVHRWMDDVDDFIAALQRDRGGSTYRDRREPPAERRDPQARSVLESTPLHRGLQKAHEGVRLAAAILLILPLGWTGGVMLVATYGLQFSGSMWIDGTLVSLVPWVVAYAGYAGIVSVRRRRFGPERAKPPLTLLDFVLTVAAAVGGPLLVWGFVPHAVGPAREWTDGVLVGLGVLLCWFPVREVRKALREE